MDAHTYICTYTLTDTNIYVSTMFANINLLEKGQHLPNVRTLFFLAAVCRTAVRKPVGKVKPESQNSTGGCVVVAQVEN